MRWSRRAITWMFVLSAVTTTFLAGALPTVVASSHVAQPDTVESISFISPAVGYAVAWTGPSQIHLALYMTTAGGVHWRLVNSALPASAESSGYLV